MVSEEEMRFLINFFKTHPHLHNGVTPWNKPYRKDEVDGYARMSIKHVQNEEFNRIIKRIEIQAGQHIFAEFGVHCYPERTQMNAWSPLKLQHPHDDAYTGNDTALDPEGYRNKKPHRFYTCMTYLNDGYEGGELYFPPQPKCLAGLDIKAVAGESVIFQGIDQIHGVRKTRRDYRWTIATWFTVAEEKMTLHNKLHADDDSFET
jgi:hypothetical protein